MKSCAKAEAARNVTKRMTAMFLGGKGVLCSTFYNKMKREDA